MKVELIYPSVQKKRRQKLGREAVRWTFLLAAYIGAVVNFCTKGQAWSVVLAWSLWFVWSFVFSRDLVEFTRISQASKFLLYTCILLILIDVLLAPGWAMFVIPLICVGGLVTIGILFFTDLDKQRQNSMPLLWLIFASNITIISSFIGWPERSWPVIALGAAAFGMLVLCIRVLGKSLLGELRKRFYL